jgi:hypothetical protein
VLEQKAKFLATAAKTDSRLDNNLKRQKSRNNPSQLLSATFKTLSNFNPQFMRTCCFTRSHSQANFTSRSENKNVKSVSPRKDKDVEIQNQSPKQGPSQNDHLIEDKEPIIDLMSN